jgi:hypothetical protein
LFGLYVASKALPETEACVQQPGTVRGADGSRLKQKPVSYDSQASLACVLGSVEVRERDWRNPFGFEIETSPARFNPHQDQKHRWRYQPEACWIFLLPGGLSRVCLGCCFVFTFCLLLCLIRRFVASWIIRHLTLLSVACLIVCGLPLSFDFCLYCLLLAVCLYCLLFAICLHCLLFAFVAQHRNVYFTEPMLKASPTPTHYPCRKSTSLRPSSQPVHAIHVPRRRTTRREYDYVSLQGTTSDSPEMLLLHLKQRDYSKQQYDSC